MAGQLRIVSVTTMDAEKRRTRKQPNDLVKVKRSRVHGTGVFAAQPIKKGARIIEYTGERISWKEAQDLPPLDPDDPHHTFFFSLDDGRVINAAVGGNEARWINHSCAPNCKTTERDGRVYIVALRNLKNRRRTLLRLLPRAGRPANESAGAPFRLSLRERGLPRHDAGAALAHL